VTLLPITLLVGELQEVFMTKLILTLIIAALLGGSASTLGQTASLPKGPLEKTGMTGETASTRTPRPASESVTKARRFWFFGTLSNVFDSNIEQEPQGLRSSGYVAGMGFHFQNSTEKPSFAIEYEAGLHRYTNTDKWNRVSHSLTTSYKRHLFGRWYARTTGELALRGSSEDRELNNQYLLGQQIEYRPTANIRLIGFAAYRLKRDPLDPGKNSIDPYIGAKFVQRLRGERKWELGYRNDHNRSWDARNRYVRWSYGAQFETPLFQRDRLTFEASYRPRLFARTVKVDGARVPRRDQRWGFGVLWERPLNQRVTMGVFYRFEKRLSNNPEKRYNEHQPGLHFTYRW
jgi:hypothetical protein